MWKRNSHWRNFMSLQIPIESCESDAHSCFTNWSNHSWWYNATKSWSSFQGTWIKSVVFYVCHFFCSFWCSTWILITCCFLQNHMSEMFAYHATMMSNTLGTSIVVFTRTGFMSILLSHYRPSGTIFAFTNELVSYTPRFQICHHSISLALTWVKDTLILDLKV